MEFDKPSIVMQMKWEGYKRVLSVMVVASEPEKWGLASKLIL